MRKYYTRACNFHYGKAAKKLIKKNLGLPLCGNNNIAFSEVDVLVVVIDDSHSLADLCLYLLGAELNISFIYALIQQSQIGNPIIAVAVDDLTLAGQLLVKKGFNLLGEADFNI